MVVWVALFPFTPDEIEPIDTVLTAFALAFSGGTALVVVRLGFPVLELGWGLFTYSFYVRFLDSIAEGPETFESLLPGTIQLVSLGVILIGFARTTGRLRSSLTERDERLTVLNRVLRHNLRNNLHVIIGALEHAKDHTNDDRTAEIAAHGFESATDLSELSEKIREIDAVLEDTDPSTGPEALNAIVESKIEEFRAAYPEVEFELRTPPTSPVISADGVDAAIGELIENACEHNDAADRIVEVTVESDDGDAVVTVHDNGSGIPTHELKPIRDRDESALRHGSGIGLWFVLWAVERAGGDVSFEYDDGQTVILRVPEAKGNGLWSRLSLGSG